MPEGRVDHALLRRLAEAVGTEHVFADRERVEPYTHDETQGLSAWPEAVVLPADTAEVSAVLRLAYEAGVPVTPRGAGTGKSGAAVPTHGGLVLSLARLNRILEIDRENGFAVVEPGVITEDLQNAAAEQGLFYAPDPASRGSCHLGGNIQTNAGGLRAVKYGVTADHVFGLTLVLADGSVIPAGGKNRKDSSGYGLVRLVVGSEGTLAVVTRAVLRLLPLPKSRGLLLAPFASLPAAAGGVEAALCSGPTPSALELVEGRAFGFGARIKETAFPFPDAEAHLLVEADGETPEAVAADLERIGAALLDAGAIDVLTATERRRMEELWAVRRAIAEGLKAYTTYSGVDSVVPRARITDLVRLARAAGAKHGLDVVSYGHAGDGNLHVNLLRTERQKTDAEWRAAADAAHEDVVRAALSLGGSISGEHGIGVKERRLLPLRHTPEAIGLMQRIKAAFDPKGMLNPGKVFP
ncbi:MAG: FAD-binding protein [Planctomycetes bacterium]|nr:FAD-binding protein [Planctomycetota bacterium]